MPAAGVWLVWLIGQIARDRTWVTGIFFYLPSPVLVAILLGTALIGLCKRRRIAAAVLCVLAIPPGVFVIAVENSFVRRIASTVHTEEAPWRLVHWNVGGSRGWEKALHILRESAPDICLVSEFPREREPEELVAALGADYDVEKADRMVIVARGELQRGRWLERSRRLKIYAVRWKYRGVELQLLAVDLSPNVFLARDASLLRLVERIRELDPDIVVGDFNSPRRSRALSALPEGYVHAYDAVGRGWSYTWPAWFPVYAIDQCIVGSRIEPVHYELRTALCSDHRRQVLTFVPTSD
jgi:vancomycin resistance protein VanJ